MTLVHQQRASLGGSLGLSYRVWLLEQFPAGVVFGDLGDFSYCGGFQATCEDTDDNSGTHSGTEIMCV